MKAFRDFLIEATLSAADALKLLGLSTSFSQDDLKTAYKKAAVANHPDRGGDLETMKKINAAYEMLKSQAGKRADAQASRDWWNAVREKDAAFVKAAFKKVVAAFKPQLFEKHFEDIFGEQFTTKVEKNEEKGSFSSFAVIQGQWFNAARTTVITLTLSVSAASRHDGGLATDNVDVAVSVIPEIYHNKKKIKLTQRNWSLETDYRMLNTPEKLFPKAKLAAKKDKTGGKFSKKDAILALVRELGATTFDKDGYIKVPLPKVEGDAHVLLYRVTSFGSGSYGTNGIYVNNRKVEGLAALVMGEDINNITWLIERLKKVQKLSTVEAVKQEMKNVADFHSANRSAIYDGKF